MTHDILRYINILTYLLTYLQDESRRRSSSTSSARSAGGAQDDPLRTGGVGGRRHGRRASVVVVPRRPHRRLPSTSVAAVRRRAPADPRPRTTSAPAEAARNHLDVRDARHRPPRRRHLQLGPSLITTSPHRTNCDEAIVDIGRRPRHATHAMSARGSVGAQNLVGNSAVMLLVNSIAVRIHMTRHGAIV